jgi:hypothetical protein
MRKCADVWMASVFAGLTRNFKKSLISKLEDLKLK